MIEDITEDNIDQYMGLSQGYIVNMTSKTEAPYTKRACAHNLAYYSERTCRFFADSPQATKFYAPTLQAAQIEAQQRWPNLPFEECPFCKKK